MKTRYFIFISYKGTSYHGWQVQPGALTVQKTLDDALTTILEEKIQTTGAGRTDTGVHAKFFCAHFDSFHQDLHARGNLVFRLNTFLPRDISVNLIRKVLPDAHARFSALSRTYKYYITRFKDPFANESSWFIYGELDHEKMNALCEILFRQTDFTSFSKLHTDVKTNNCIIYHADWKSYEDKLIFTIKADRFLRNMVRAIVGTMVNVGRGKIGAGDFEDIINAHDRCKAGISAPAQGLFLADIEYPSGIYI